MTLVGLIVSLIVAGVLLYLINNLIPLDARIRLLINVLAILFVCLWFLQQVGLLGPLHLRLR